MITFTQYLTESRSAPLYHATKLYNANKILKDDILYTSPQYQGATEGSKAIFFTRSLQHAKYVYGATDLVVFEFDQQKLNQRYKITPIKNHPDIRSKNHRPMYMKTKDSNTSLGGNEFEEIVTRNITNVNDYITKIYVSISSKKILDKYGYLADDPRIQFI